MQIRPTFLALLLTLALSQPAHATKDTTALAIVPAEGSVLDEYTSTAGQLVDQALSYLGIRYRFGGASPETGLDCSGLVLNVFRNAVGLDLPRTAREMAGLGDKIGRQDLKPGDLVFFNTMRRTFSHVGIYLGDGKFVHAPARGGKVRVENISDRYWTQRFNGARRLLDETPPAADATNLLSAR